MKITAMVGSEPIWKRFLRPLLNERGEVEVKGEKGEEGSDPPPDKETDTPSEKDENSDPSSENLPWDKDPRWKEWREKEKSIDKFMETNGFESVEEMLQHVADGKDLKGKLSGRDLTELIKKAETLESYEEYWAKQEEDKKRQEELPDETIRRLEKEKEAEKKRADAIENKHKEAEAAKKAVRAYEKEVNTLLKEKLDASESKFIKEFFGIGNPLNDIDITDTKAVTKMVDEGLKKKEAYDQAVIKRYLDGKMEVPKIPSGQPPTDPPVEIKTMKGARKALKERLESAFKG